MATPYAFVTLVTSDFYLPGALALAAALKDVHPSPPTPPEVEFETVCLVTPETVDVSSIKLLRRAFNLVIGVEIIEQEDDKKLRLLGRPDLTTVLTKLHIFRLTQYSKIIFLDADVLPILPISHLFNEPHEFAAVPDVGWPDIFNSGVLVVTPGEDKFKELMELQKTKGSWDGGDQGILNEWRGSNWHRLSFVYNTTPTAAYTYAPAYERFGSAIRAIHFIGSDKPWKGLTYRSPGIKSSQVTLGDGTKRVYNYESLVDRWYDVYDTHYRMEPDTTQYDFHFDTYQSAWDFSGGVAVPTTSGTTPSGSGSGAPLDLDELRRLAIQGLSSFGSGEKSAPAPAPAAVPGEHLQGEYRSMPLEGRVDLMRPRKEPEPEPETEAAPPAESGEHNNETEGPGTPRPSHIRLPSDQGGYFRTQTLPTPAPDEVPPAPYHHGHSLPPTQTPTPYYGPPSNEPHSQGLQVFYHPQAQGEHGSEYVVGSQQHDPSQHSRQSHSHTHPHTSHHPHHHRGFSSPVQQRSNRDPHDSSDSDRTPPARYPPGHPRHHQHSQSQGFIHSPQPHHHIRHEVQQERYNSPARGDRRRGYETPPQHRGHHDPRSHGHRGSGQNSPAHDQARRGRSHHEGQRASQQGQTQHHHHGHSHGQQHHEQHQHQHQQHHEPPRRPISPPKVAWNPAVEPPPKEAPPASAFPQDTYFPNIWDQSPSQHHDATYQSPQSPQADRASGFFSPPPPPTIPDQLIREGQYANVLGAPPSQPSPESVSSPPAPDKSKVHAVFPWEEKPRHVPRRVFPRTDTPPPVANYIESERTSSPVSTPPPPAERSNPQVQATPSPVGSPWTNVGFSNAWDAVPSIQRYASKLVGSPNIFPYQYMAPPPPPPKADNWRQEWEREREREVQEKHDASSMDGDDEDEGDELDDEQFENSDGSARGKRSQSARRRSRAQSLSKKKKYRSRAVQVNPETTEIGIQCSIISQEDIPSPRTSREVGTETMPTSTPAPAPAPAAAPAGVGLGIRRNWQQGDNHPALLPSATIRDFKHTPEQSVGTPVIQTTARSGEPFSSLATPSGLRSPATLGSPRTYSPPTVTSPLRIPTPPKVTSPPAVSSPLRGPPSPVVAAPAPQSAHTRSPQMTARPTGSPRKLSSSSLHGSGSSRASSPVVGTAARMSQSTPSPKHSRLSSLTAPYSPQLGRSISVDSMVTPSPTTTQDSPITPGDMPRRGSRVWDPARGVDVFKRGSEEVLARFLRMGSFDEESEKQRQAAA